MFPVPSDNIQLVDELPRKLKQSRHKARDNGRLAPETKPQGQRKHVDGPSNYRDQSLRERVTRDTTKLTGIQPQFGIWLACIAIYFCAPLTAPAYTSRGSEPDSASTDILL